MNAQHVVAIHSARGSGTAKIPLPPFNPGALRMSTMDHLKKYRNLWKKHRRRQNQKSFYGRHEDPVQTSPLDDDGIEEQSFSQSFLLTDLGRIVQAATYLEQVLWDAFTKASGIHAALLASSHFICSSTLPYLTYPLASYHIGKKVVDVWQTSSLRKCAEQLYQQVKDGEEIGDNDVVWLSKGKWNAIPWHKIEPKIL